MKKILIFTLCAAAAAGLCAQKKVVDQAKKLEGKSDRLTEARALIQEAIANPETANQANTYYVAGNIELKSYDGDILRLEINKNDASVSDADMADKLINAYRYYMKALELDSLPNEKGEIKPKHSKDIWSKLKGHATDFYKAGATKYSKQKYYPEAYDAFCFYGNNSIDPDTVRAQGFFYAGVSAYSAKEIEAARKAFAKSVDLGYSDPNAIIYQIACVEYEMNNDSTKAESSKKELLELAKQGYDIYGLKSPFFISNMVDTYHSLGENQKAYDAIADAMGKYPDKAILYGLRGWLNNVNNKDEESIADYLKAVSLPDVDSSVLFKAARKLYTTGSNILGTSQNPSEVKQEVKATYFDKAKELADRAASMTTDHKEKNQILNLIDQIDYILDTNY